ncbi:unnamed protein product [Amoebophrya sp. A25]|nr:unnamed protein product [Amoebophrya sp. A25]|eukprot:GSA25T00016528001.1
MPSILGEPELGETPVVNAKKKKSKKKVEPPKPHIVVEYKGEINEDRVERVANTMDQLLEQFSSWSTRFMNPSMGMIRKRKLESDILQCIERMRDLMWETVRGDKRELDCVFGGACVRIGKVYYQMDLMERSDEGGTPAKEESPRTSDAVESPSGKSSNEESGGSSSSTVFRASSSSTSTGSPSLGRTSSVPSCATLLVEPRWKDLRQAASSVKAVLESMGHFKQWRPGQEEEDEESSTDEEDMTEDEKHDRWLRKLLKIKNGPDDKKRTLDDFKKIDEITKIEDCLNLKVDTKYQTRDWMMWMVHRVHLNDPTLQELSFAGQKMPPPDKEYRVAPKLAKAVGGNSYLQRLYLQNSTLQSGEADTLAGSLRSNSSLKELNLEGNFVDVSALSALADALLVNDGLEEIRMSGQRNECMSNRGMGQKFEEILGQAMMKNQSLITLGVALYNPTWRDVVDRALTRNNDRKKRMERRKNGVSCVTTSSASVMLSGGAGVPRETTLDAIGESPSTKAEAAVTVSGAPVEEDGKYRGPSVMAFRERIEATKRATTLAGGPGAAGRMTSVPTSSSPEREVSRDAPAQVDESDKQPVLEEEEQEIEIIDQGNDEIGATTSGSDFVKNRDSTASEEASTTIASDVAASSGSPSNDEEGAESKLTSTSSASPRGAETTKNEDETSSSPTQEASASIVQPPPQQKISWLVTTETGEGHIASATLPIAAEEGDEEDPSDIGDDAETPSAAATDPVILPAPVDVE